MNRTELCQMAYTQYSAEADIRDAFESKATFTVGGLTLLGGVAIALASRADLPAWEEYVIFGLFWLFFIGSACYVIRFVIPPKYLHVVPLKQWLDWREEYSQEVASAGFDEEESELYAARAMTARYTNKLATAAAFNDDVNQLRRQHYRRSTYLLICTSIALFLATVIVQTRSMIT